MLYLRPTSDGPAADATPVGAASAYQCLTPYIQGDPDYVSVLSAIGFFQVAYAGSYGPGFAFPQISYSAPGSVGPSVLVFEGTTLVDTKVLPPSSGFTRYQYKTAALVGGSNLKVTFTNVGGDATARVSYLEMVVPCTLPTDRIMSQPPYDKDDALAGTVCSRTRYWIPGHDRVDIDGRSYSKSMANPPKGRRGGR